MRDFLLPPAAFAPLLTWIWNSRLDESALREQLRSIAENGFGGVVIRPGAVLSPLYLSEEWMQLVRACIQECRLCGLELWLTDEGPAHLGTSAEDGTGSGRSGTAGGRITREQRDLRSHYLRFQSIEVARDTAESWRFPAVGGELLYAVAVPLSAPGNRLDFSRTEVLTKQPLERAPRLLARLESDVRVLIFSQERAGYIDLLNPEAAGCFLEYTHERYKAALGSDFDGVTGFWMYRPTLRDTSESEEINRLPWSPLLMDSFAIQPGYELLEWLPALVADLGDDASRLRQDFWRTVGRMAGEGFWQPLSGWAAANGKFYTGLLEGKPLNTMVAHCGDAAPIYRMLTRPGVEGDGLNAGGTGLDMGRGLHGRLAASVVALNGAQSTSGPNRVPGEIWRDAGWGATPGERLASLHHLMRQGVNSIVAHGAYASLGDGVSGVQAPSEMHQPYAAQWKPLAEYISRCSYVMSHGRCGARVALLWPIRSAWAHHHPKGHRLTRWVEEDLYATALMLDDLHFEFLFVTEEDLLEGKIEGAKVLCGVSQHPFEMVVLPSVTALHRDTWQQLQTFVEAGGKVVSLGLMPRYSERGRDREFEAAISKTTLLTVGDVYDAYAEMENSGGQAPTTVGFPITKDNEAGGRMACYQPRLNDNVKDALLRVRKILKESLTPELETQSPNILYARRILTGEESFDEDIITPVGGDIEEEIPTVKETTLEPLEDEDFEWDQPFDWGEAFRDDEAEGEVEADEEENSADESTFDGRDALHSDALAQTLEVGVEVAAESSSVEESAVEVEDSESELVPLQLNEALPSRGVPDGGDVFWVLNADEEAQRINLRLRPAQEGTPHVLDAWSGQIHRHPVWTQYPEIEGGGLSLALEMAPHEAKMIWIRPFESDEDADAAHVEASTFQVENFDGRVASGYITESGTPRIAVRRGERVARETGDPLQVPPHLLLPDSWQMSRIGPNVLPGTQWHWRRGRHLPGDQRWFFGRDNWQPLPSPTAGAGSITESSALEGVARFDISGIVTFRSTFEVAEAPRSLFLQWEPLDVPSAMYLNGELLEPCIPNFAANPPWNDTRWLWYELSEWLEIGENVLSCVADCRERGGAFAAENTAARTPGVPRLVGDFALTGDRALAADQTLLVGEGSWHENGLPFFSGALDYKQWVKVPAEWNRCRVFLEISRTRDVCGVWVNGRFCGVCYSAPYRFDVSRYILKGASNEIRLRVWNTAEAALEGHLHEPRPSGLLGPVRLVAYPLVHAVV